MSAGGFTLASAGNTSVIGDGPVFAVRVTARVTVTEFVAASVATTVMVFAPVSSDTFVVNTPFCPTVTGLPFTVSETVLASCTVPLTGIVASVVIAPFAGLVTASTGGVLSRFTCRIIDVALPAASVASTMMKFAPSAMATLVEKAPPLPPVSGTP